jgi:hypothetical protein
MNDKKIFLGLAIFFLVVWAATALILRGTIAYALSDATPVVIPQGEHLASHTDRFVEIAGTPIHDLAIVYKRYGVFSYWYPLAEHDNRLVVKTDDPLPRSTRGPQVFGGRLRRLHQVAFSSNIMRRFDQARGFELPPDAFVIVAGESPQTFRPLLLMFVPLTAAWLVLLIIVIIALRLPRRLRRPSARARSPSPSG